MLLLAGLPHERSGCVPMPEPWVDGYPVGIAALANAGATAIRFDEQGRVNTSFVDSCGNELWHQTDGGSGWYVALVGFDDTLIASTTGPDAARIHISTTGEWIRAAPSQAGIPQALGADGMLYGMAYPDGGAGALMLTATTWAHA